MVNYLGMFLWKYLLWLLYGLYVSVGIIFVGSVIRVVLNVVVYYTFMWGDFADVHITEDTAWEYNDSIVVAALVNTFFDFICSFLINYLMILIPYQWYLN